MIWSIGTKILMPLICQLCKRENRETDAIQHKFIFNAIAVYPFQSNSTNPNSRVVKKKKFLN